MTDKKLTLEEPETNLQNNLTQGNPRDFIEKNILLTLVKHSTPEAQRAVINSLQQLIQNTALANHEQIKPLSEVYIRDIQT